MTFAHMMTVFSIMWFFIGHILVFVGPVSCWLPRAAIVISITLIIIQDVLCIWLIFNFVLNNSRVLSWLTKKVEQRRNQLSNIDKHHKMEEAVVDDKSVQNDKNLMII